MNGGKLVASTFPEARRSQKAQKAHLPSGAASGGNEDAARAISCRRNAEIPAAQNARP